MCHPPLPLMLQHLMLVDPRRTCTARVHKFDGIHPDMKGTAVADSRLSPDSELSRGCGGVGIAWKKHLHASPVSGYPSDRICTITVDVLVQGHFSMRKMLVREKSQNLLTNAEQEWIESNG